MILNKMKILKDAIIVEAIQKADFNNSRLKKRLLEIEPLKFIPYFLLNADIEYNNFFFLSNLEYWEKLNFVDWQQVLVEVSSSSLGIYSFFVITYKFLKVDFIPYFMGMKEGDQRKKRLSLMRFFEDAYILQHDNKAEEIINFYDLDGEYLQRIRSKLLLQGALKADLIEPRKELGFGLGYTKAKPPESWNTWYDEIK